VGDGVGLGVGGGLGAGDRDGGGVEGAEVVPAAAAGWVTGAPVPPGRTCIAAANSTASARKPNAPGISQRSRGGGCRE